VLLTLAVEAEQEALGENRQPPMMRVRRKVEAEKEEAV
tara:strand:- start:47 stop:160 length:114 start_codon:yes stop_codon:yes gene_type:complete